MFKRRIRAFGFSALSFVLGSMPAVVLAAGATYAPACASTGTGIGAAFVNLADELRLFGGPIAGAITAYGGLRYFFGHTPQTREQGHQVMMGAGVGTMVTLLGPNIASVLIKIMGGC